MNGNLGDTRVVLRTAVMRNVPTLLSEIEL
jgi:hypothetical protein